MDLASTTTTTTTTTTATTTASAPRSNPSRSAAPSPQHRGGAPFDAALLRAYMKKLLAGTLGGAVWDRDRVRAWCREIGERVKLRALEMEPRGFKYMVTTQINENLGQGGRADLACHWEDSDAVAQEVFANDSLICVCIAFAIRTG